MRKIRLQIQISVDGYVAMPDGELDWTTRVDEELWRVMNELVDHSDTLLLGRKMAQDFVPHFESFDTDHPRISFARKMVDIPKVIFTKTLTEPFGKNTSLATGTLANEISELKNRSGKDILVYGGAGFVSSLIAGRHIDEFLLFVNPILINKGMRIFDKLNVRQQLSLVSATSYPCGIAVLHYNVRPE